MKEILMNDDMEIDYGSFYRPTATVPTKISNSQNKTEADPTRTGQVLNMMSKYNHGTTMMCIVPDKVLTVVDPDKPGMPRLFRKVQYGYGGRIAMADNEKLTMNIQIPRLQDFLCELTQDQKNMILNLRAQAKNFSQFTSYSNKDKYVRINSLIKSLDCAPQSIYLYGKLIKIISKDKGELKTPEIGHMRVFKFDKGELGKSDFATVLNASISNKIAALGSAGWMKDYFSRNTGTRTKLVSVNVDQSQGQIKKYMLNISLEEVAPFELTEEDLKVAENLNSRVFDITKFDEGYYNKLSAAFNVVQSVIDNMSK